MGKVTRRECMGTGTCGGRKHGVNGGTTYGILSHSNIYVQG